MRGRGGIQAYFVTAGRRHSRHGRTCSGHPFQHSAAMDGRNKSGHDSMRGVDGARRSTASTMSASSVQAIEQVLPGRVLRNEHIQLPGTGPVFHGLLSLDSSNDFVMPFGEYQPGQSIALGEAFADAVAMFLRPTREVAGDLNVKRAEGAVRDDVDPATAHGRSIGIRPLRMSERHSTVSAAWDGRDKPGHDAVTLADRGNVIIA